MESTDEDLSLRSALFAAHHGTHWREPGRCPRCRSHETEWLPESKTAPAGGFACRACNAETLAPKLDPAPLWEARAARRLPDWDRYERTDGLERWAYEQDEAATAAEKAKTKQREIGDVLKLVRGAVTEDTGIVERTLIGELAAMLFGAAAEKIATKLRAEARSWYRRDPRRPAFGRLAHALAFDAGPIGIGPINLEIAESKVRGRQSGFRNGLVHAKASSGNGSLGGAKGMAAIERCVDVERAVVKAGLSREDVGLLAELHSVERKRPTRADRLRVVGLVVPPAPVPAQETKEKAAARERRDRERVEAAMPATMKRLRRAQTALERAMRLPPENAISAYDQQPHDPTEAPLLRGASLREQEEREEDSEEHAKPRGRRPRPQPSSSRNFSAEVFA